MTDSLVRWYIQSTMTDLVARLEEIQAREGMTARAMAARLGIREDYWWHLRRRSRQGRRPSLSVVQKALTSFPELYPVVMSELTKGGA